MEKTPSELEEAIEEGVHLTSRYHLCKQGEVPVGGEYFDVHPDLQQVREQVRQMRLHEPRDESAMLDVAW